MCIMYKLQPLNYVLCLEKMNNNLFLYIIMFYKFVHI